MNTFYKVSIRNNPGKIVFKKSNELSNLFKQSSTSRANVGFGKPNMSALLGRLLDGLKCNNYFAMLRYNPFRYSHIELLR